MLGYRDMMFIPWELQQRAEAAGDVPGILYQEVSI